MFHIKCFIGYQICHAWDSWLYVGIISKCCTLNVLLGIRCVMLETHVVIIMVLRRDHLKMLHIKHFTGYQICYAWDSCRHYHGLSKGSSQKLFGKLETHVRIIMVLLRDHLKVLTIFPDMYSVLQHWYYL
jgi:hypothetical protein